jgi:hypothetical protein
MAITVKKLHQGSESGWGEEGTLLGFRKKRSYLERRRLGRRLGFFLLLAGRCASLKVRTQHQHENPPNGSRGGRTLIFFFEAG